MKKQVIGILVCMMLMAMIPVAAGLNLNTNPDTEPVGIGKELIILRGVGTGFRTGVAGKVIFFGVRVHYTAIGLQGVRRGVLRLQRITLPDAPNGIITNSFICVMLRGHIDDII